MRPRLLLPAAALLVLAVTGCTADDSASGNSGAPGGARGPGPANGANALGAVDGLTVKGRAPKTGYEREQFGAAWLDTDSNGCGTRDDILNRDLAGAAFKDGACKVASGVLEKDPYTGGRIEYERGKPGGGVDIDHVVALSDAWQKGAGSWDKGKRIAFANDPLNLLAVEAAANRKKGDGDAATWLPPDRSYRCTYVAAQVAVKQKYRLWVTAGERDAMKRVLSDCPEQRLPTGGNPTAPPARLVR
ncbi:HNH endonuclease family protein [Streptomyces sp. NPDC051211]|uniref:HNH endonuclease family protein n=1 Tax=Streptomyces sp. NPDC051211 TaxID=3154643 RepID=UPI00344FD224